MSEFRFLCPECGQKILGDTAYGGAQITCPTCQKNITIPAEVPAASPPVAVSPPKTSSPFSKLAIASLMCSVFAPLGWIPGIICGHLAKTRMRRNIFLEGEKMADAGLLIGYCILMATVAAAGIFLLANWHFRPVMTHDSPETAAAMQSRLVDEIIMGENEDDHDVDGQMHYTTSNKGKQYHTANRGGSFSYMMTVLPHEPMTLNCRYWGSEKKGHEFDIAVDGQIIATENLTARAPGQFFDVEYKIPMSLTRGKTEVKVEFQAHAGMTAGGLYACQMLK